MASGSASRLWAQLANCVQVVTCGVCGTPSPAVQDAALAEPLLQNPRQHPAASAEAPSLSVLTAARQQPALPARTSTLASQPPPEVATAAGSSFDTNSGSNDTSGAHANPAPAQAYMPNLVLPAEQKSKDGADVSGVDVTDLALQVPPFPKLKSSQPAQAHVIKSQAPPGAKPASTDHSHDQHAALAATGQQQASQRSAEPPVIAEESSKPSTDQTKAATDKKPSEASSVAAAASPDSESCSQPETTTATQVGTASQERDSAAAAPESLPSVVAAKAVHSQAQVRPSAKGGSPAGSAATQQTQVRPSTEEAAPAADDSSAAKDFAAKQSEVRSVAEDKRSAATSTAATSTAATGATAKQSPVRPSAADKSLPAKDTAAKQSPVEPAVVEASEAHQRSAAAGTAAKQSPVGLSAKEDSSADERFLATSPAAKYSRSKTPSGANLGQAAASQSSQSVVQSNSKSKQGQPSSADGANAVAAHESLSAEGAPTETANSHIHIQATQGKDQQSAGRKLAEQEEAHKAQPQTGDEDAKKPQLEAGAHGILAAGDAVHSAEDAVPSSASAKESQRGGGSGLNEGRPDSCTIEPQVQEITWPGVPQEPSKGGVAKTASPTSQYKISHASTLSEPGEKLSQPNDVKSPPSEQHLSGETGCDNSCAAKGHLSMSLSLNDQSGIASTAVKGTSSRGNGDSVASALAGAHDASPDQEGDGSAKGQHAVAVRAGNRPGAAGTAQECDTFKTAGRETEGGDADSGHDGAAQMTETGTANKNTAAADAGAGKKKNRSKKKKKGK